MHNKASFTGRSVLTSCDPLIVDWWNVPWPHDYTSCAAWQPLFNLWNPQSHPHYAVPITHGIKSDTKMWIINSRCYGWVFGIGMCKWMGCHANTLIKPLSINSLAGSIIILDPRAAKRDVYFQATSRWLTKKGFIVVLSMLSMLLRTTVTWLFVHLVCDSMSRKCFEAMGMIRSECM